MEDDYLEIRSRTSPATLRFSDFSIDGIGEDRFTAHYSAPPFAGQTHCWMADPTYFLWHLISTWPNWEKVEQFQSHDQSLAITATHDGRGYLTLRFRLADQQEMSAVEGWFDFEIAELDRLAARCARFFQTPESYDEWRARIEHAQPAPPTVAPQVVPTHTGVLSKLLMRLAGVLNNVGL